MTYVGVTLSNLLYILCCKYFDEYFMSKIYSTYSLTKKKVDKYIFYTLNIKGSI